MIKFTPDVFLDTMGYAFTYPFVRLLAGCPVVAYVHYPTISSDMISVVRDRDASFNNDSSIARSAWLSDAKLKYYQLFAKLYGFVGRQAQVVMVNSTWTKNHIVQIWKIPNRTNIVYPPCGTMALANIDLKTRKKIILSIAQFRPEKNHALQIEAFKEFLDKNPKWKKPSQVHANASHSDESHDEEFPTLVLLGSSRNAEDEKRVAGLKNLATKLKVDNQIEFVLNASYAKLQEYLFVSTIGLHTMLNEHFGIGIVEYMAAGLIPVAHRSGGPELDIVSPGAGYLATTKEEYADAMNAIFNLDENERIKIASAAREISTRFSDQAFEGQWIKAISELKVLSRAVKRK